jgi:pimeloyl-ACP methyl ester carboxylesterase
MPGAIGRVVSRETMRGYLTEPFMSGAEYQHKVGLIAGFDARAWLPEIACPSIVMVGKRDPTVPPRWGRELASLLPRSTLVELNCGHLGYLAVPAEIRDHVDRWFALDSGAARRSAIS